MSTTDGGRAVPASSRRIRCEVAVVGLGPVGATLAALLGERGVDVVVVDPLRSPTPYPRAIAADDETLRTILGLPGLADPGRLFAAGSRVDVRSARGPSLTTVSLDAAPLGIPELSFFHQPSLERELRSALADVPDIRLRLGERVTRISDVPGGVRLELVTADASPSDAAGVTTLEAAWAVGCDGAGSLVRRQRGIAYVGRTFDEPWVVVDIDSPQPLAHLPDFTFLVDRARPTVNMPRPGGHRFEFMVLPGEDPEVMAERGQVDRWLAPHLAALDPAERANLRVVRAAVYTYHSRTAERWRDGRVLLAGDAAHCMPPFGGQGMGAGIGDALSLAWRLDEVRRGLGSPGLLDDYERERRPRIAEMTRTAHVAGRLLTATSAPGSAAARVALRTIDGTPVLGRRWRAGSLRTRPRVRAADGLRLPGAGEPLPNPLVRVAGLTSRLDDVLPAGWALLGTGGDPWSQVPERLRSGLRERSARAVCVMVPGTQDPGPMDSVMVLGDEEGLLLKLFRRGSEDVEAPVVLVRPDRFLAGVGPGPALAAVFERLTRSGRTATSTGSGDSRNLGGVGVRW